MEKLDSEILRKHKGKSFVGVSTAVAIFNSKGQLFMAQRSKNARDEHGRWDVCGGGLKWDVKIEDNIRREMAEEFGALSGEPFKPIGIREAFRVDQHGDKTHWVCLDHIVVLKDNEAAKVKIVETEIFDDSGWFDLGNLPEPLHSVIDANFIERLKLALKDYSLN